MIPGVLKISAEVLGNITTILSDNFRKKLTHRPNY